MLGSLWSRVVIPWIGHISKMYIFSFNFWFWFGFWSSFPYRISPEIHYFIQIGHLVLRRRVCRDHWEVVLYFTKLDISLWCIWFLSISGIDSDYRAHFRPESVRYSFILFKIGHFVLRRRVCWDHWEVVLYFT